MTADCVLNCFQLYEQLSLAVARQATSLWVLNVGDLKPYEREIEFFLNLAYDSAVWTPDNLNTYVTSWAQREFEVSEEDSADIAQVLANLTRYNARKKPELLGANTFSLTNYRE